MFEHFNTHARRALFFARYEASARGGRIIDTHHLLLGVLRENDDATRELFSVLGVNPLTFSERWPPVTDRISSSAELPLSEDAKKALAYGAVEAERTRSTEVAPIHLLLGILKVRNSLGAKALAEAGLTHGVVDARSAEIITEVKKRQALEERTPFVLRSTHYQLIDTIREQVTASRGQPTSREEVVLALFDGLSVNARSFPAISSLDELRVRIAEAILGLPPRP